jgi:hypothetical protein
MVKFLLASLKLLSNIKLLPVTLFRASEAAILTLKTIAPEAAYDLYTDFRCIQ